LHLTDADWAVVNNLRRAYAEGGTKSLSGAVNQLVNGDVKRCLRVMAAFLPKEVRQTLKDVMAEQGLTEEDLRELLRQAESPARIQ
jgi:hypothetical protein